MSCAFCLRVFGLKWLCACGNLYRHPSPATIAMGEEIEQRTLQDDPDAWYAAEVERMKERAPA